MCLTLSDGTFNQVSFVNAICTTHGGQHVTAIADQIADAVVAASTKKAGGAKAGLEIKPSHVKNYMTLFVNAQIENPAFDSQVRSAHHSPDVDYTCNVHSPLTYNPSYPHRHPDQGHADDARQRFRLDTGAVRSLLEGGVRLRHCGPSAGVRALQGNG